MRRLLTVVVGTLVVLGGLVALVAAFSARDDAGVETAAAGPGELQPDRGAGHDATAPDATLLPTSGPHRPLNVTRDASELSGDELLHALEQGNVVFAYGARRPPAALTAVQEAVAGPFDAELAAAGQSVILMRVPGLDGTAGLAWRRLLTTPDAADPRLREFAEAWLGTGAPG